MIHLFTDFGNNGPYVGELKAVLLRKARQQTVVDLMHDAPMFNPAAGAFLLAALARRFVAGDACLAVVDPGVGDYSRRPVLIEADSIVYCGPDNGLFHHVIRRARKLSCYEILWRPDELSDSFHGRDIFAPVLADYLSDRKYELKQIDYSKLTGMDWPESLAEIIYIDHFGNAVSGIPAECIKRSEQIQFNNYNVNYARTFSELDKGQAFWYTNSMGLVEIAVNQGSAAEYFKLVPGAKLQLINTENRSRKNNH